MKVSILVPIYGVEKSIERCAISLFEQTYENIEYIFVNDCTKDKSIDVLLKVIEKYPNRKSECHIIHHTQNKGLSAARNTALKRSIGEYIMNVDSDDYLEIDAVEKCIKNIGDADICLFGYKHIFGNSNYIKSIQPCSGIQECIKSVLQREFPVNLWGGMYKRSLYTKNNIFSIENIFMGEDYVTKPRLLYYANRISYLNEPLYNYVHYGERNLRYSDIVDLSNCIIILKDFFQTKKDYSLYKETLEKAETLTKITLLVDWAKSELDSDYLEIINNYFPKSRDYKKIGFRRKIILYLSSKGYDLILRIYIKLGLKIKSIIRY